MSHGIVISIFSFSLQLPKVQIGIFTQNDIRFVLQVFLSRNDITNLG